MSKERNKFVEAAKRGFTLVELLVVVAILGILGTIAIQNVTGHIAKTRITAAEAGVRSLQEACTTYYIQHKKLPSSLDQLIEGDDPIIEGGEGALYDPWDNKYELEVRGKRIIIKSAGEDGQMDTEDDIRSDFERWKEKDRRASF
jgi:prepilin-type N-terminal cleavage/methylation domain-containing protein